ncbi:MAG: protein BatD [Magnetococcales bacterium]|nr:protein BatD [Magnetococcales bacterium]
MVNPFSTIFIKQSSTSNLLILLAVMATLLLPTPVQGASQIKLSADRNPVALNESFQLNFEADGEADVQPDFSPLEESFDILGRQQSSRLNIINGERSRTVTWTLTLMPKQTGKVAIPSIKFGSTHSKPTFITVVDAATLTPPASGPSTPDLFFEVKTDVTNPYVQSQVVLTVRFFRAIQIASATMSEPRFEGGEVVVEPLGEGRRYETTVNNRRHIVEEHRYALFPQKSGELTILPFQIEVRTGGRNQIFGSLFSDPFGQTRSSIRRINSDAIPLQVRPIPAEFKGARWLVAHELILTEKWSHSPSDSTVSEPVTRTISLTADGIPAKQLPDFDSPEIKGLKHYSDRPTTKDQAEFSGIVGFKQQKIALIPTAPGTLLLPGFKIPWWDMDEEVLKYAELPEVEVTAKPSTALSQSSPAPVQAEPIPQTGTPIPSVSIAPAGQQPSSPVEPTVTNGVSGLTFFLGLGWLLTGLAWTWKSRTAHKKARSSEGGEVKAKSRQLLKALKSSCQSNKAQESRRLLGIWLNEQRLLHNDPHQPTLAYSEQFKEEWAKLDRYLYSVHSEQTWQGNRLWQAIETEVSQKKERTQSQEKPVLSPLYEI